MNLEQLTDFMNCKNIPMPKVGTGVGAKVVKRDLIQRIRESFGGQEPKVKPAGVLRAVGYLGNAKAMTPEDISRLGWGGGSGGGIEAYIGTELPEGTMLVNGPFVEVERVAIPHSARLWSTVVGINAPTSISMWHGANDTMIVQCLGHSKVMVDMWKIAMKSFPLVEKWANVYSHLTYEQMRMKRSWIVSAKNGMFYSFCLMEGLWMCSLESLFFSVPEEKRFSAEMVTAVGDGVQHVLKCTSGKSLAGRDTQHYAWNYDESGWLVLSLMPLPYFFPMFDSELKPVPVDQFVRAAAYGNGAMYLTSMITGDDE